MDGQSKRHGHAPPLDRSEPVVSRPPSKRHLGRTQSSLAGPPRALWACLWSGGFQTQDRPKRAHRKRGNTGNGSGETLPVFSFFLRGFQKPVASVASPLCVLAGRNGESDHASPREKRAGTESANGSPLPVPAASRRPVEKVPGFNAGGREPVSELRVLGSRWLYLLLWPPRRKSLA